MVISGKTFKDLEHQGHFLGPPSSNPTSLAPMRLMSVVKLRSKSNRTLRFAIQAGMGAAPQWFGLGPQLGESFHLRVHLERHVTLPHFRDVNILVDVDIT
jgi:hypothetical protein